MAPVHATGSPVDTASKQFYISCMRVKFQTIIDHFGGTHQALAEALGVTREAVTMWGGKIPELQAYKIQSLSEGKFTVANMPIKYRKTAAGKQGNGGATSERRTEPG